MRNGIAVVFLSTVFGAVSAHAEAVTWTLENVSFADGGTATGSFVYDADTNDLEAVNIVTTAGSAGSGGTYTLYSYSASAASFYLDDPATPGNDQLTLAMHFATALSDAGGSVAILPGNGGPSFEREDYYPNYPLEDPQDNVYFRFIDSGSVEGTAAPEPATAALVGGALLALGLRRRIVHDRRRPIEH